VTNAHPVAALPSYTTTKTRLTSASVPVLLVIGETPQTESARPVIQPVEPAPEEQTAIAYHVILVGS